MKTWGGSGGLVPRARFLSETEVKQVLEAVERVAQVHTRGKYRLLFLLLANFGPRVSEALALRARDVDLSTGSITFPTLKRWRDMPDGTRTRVHAPRTLPLPEAIGVEVGVYIRSRDLRPTDLLFPKTGRKYVWETFKRLLHEAGLSRHYRLHDLRHSAGTYLADKTRDPMLVRDVLGHQSIATSNRYLHTVQLREKLLAVPPLLPGDDGRAT